MLFVLGAASIACDFLQAAVCMRVSTNVQVVVSATVQIRGHGITIWLSVRSHSQRARTSCAVRPSVVPELVRSKRSDALSL